uniref:Uncharacterized protein n=1 Tax=Rousettus aegyptiacus TaxID=9407 RepID=A0A7J8GAH3_ROUAE|nr:hypothetical protein HJG63_011557 [Rousettus aegyptiacus]
MKNGKIKRYVNQRLATLMKRNCLLHTQMKQENKVVFLQNGHNTLLTTRIATSRVNSPQPYAVGNNASEELAENRARKTTCAARLAPSSHLHSISSSSKKNSHEPLLRGTEGLGGGQHLFSPLHPWHLLFSPLFTWTSLC